MTETVRTACPYCGVGCGLLATPDGAGGAAIKGDPDHPANFGRLCSKGSALGETLSLEGRLLRPRIGGADATWDQAIALIARRFSEAIALHGPDSVAFYVSGQLLTEDYYVANKLMKGYIGSANIDTNSRLCMASSVAGHRRAFGADTVPGTYEDLELADLVVLVGSNLAWCHPVLFQRLAAAKAARPQMKIVNIDPRRTATSEIADMELRLAPGSDVALFNALLAAIDEQGAVDAGYVLANVAGLSEALAAAADLTLAETSAQTGLSTAEIAAFARLWIGSEKVVTVYSQGVNQSSAGTDKVNAIINCHLATGRIGRPGTGPFSVTGQPNAMGGREVGGLANTLAAHLDLENAEHRAAVRNFWNSPAIADRAGLKAVDLFEGCADGRIKALWIMSTNPAVSMPEADKVAAAIRACPLTVVSDITAETDTARLADVLLPATGWGEKSGTVTNSERRISRQRAFLLSPGEARPDWRAICDVAAAMGWAEGFAYESPAAIFREHAALSGVASGLGRDFDISGLAGTDDTGYDALASLQWPVSPSKAGARFFARGGFFHRDRRARMIPVKPRGLAAATTTAFPLRLNTGRVRDHWHTMTRTSKTPRLSLHMAEPYLELHPDDAARLGVEPASLVRVSSPHGTAILRALVTERTAKGSVFAPMHWTSEWASAGRIDALVASVVDPVSGQPESKAQPVAVAPFAPAWHGYAISGRRISPEVAYWAMARVNGGYQAELAGEAAPEDWVAAARDLLGAPTGSECVSLADPSRGQVRLAFLRDGRIDSAFFAAPRMVDASRAHIRTAFANGAAAEILLTGRSGSGQSDQGAIVCSCLGVGVNAIRAAIAEHRLTSVEAVGARLQAGTSCGSCRPEISALIAAASAEEAAAC